MGMALLGDVLRNPAPYEPDMILYVPDGAEDVTLFTQVLIVQHGSYSEEEVQGHRYLLEVGVIRDVLDGLQQQLAEPPTPSQALRAVLYYAEHDAFPDLSDVK